MKLKLEHLAPYLPYGLLMIDKRYVGKDTHPMKLKHLTIDGSFWAGRSNNSRSIAEEKYLPILRPLSDLTKEILSEYYTQLMDADLERAISDTKACPLNQSYSFTRWLFENHFDVFGLIDIGLAIDKNTL